MCEKSVKIGHFSHVFHMEFHIHTPSSESRHHNTSRESTAKLEIFFHVLVYSCQPIVASVRFKVPQEVVRSQSAVVSKIWTN